MGKNKINANNKELTERIYTPESRLSVAWIRFIFDVYNYFRVFWLIEKMPFLKIKQPYAKMYERYKRVMMKKAQQKLAK